jgi:rRNA maturation protein Nop10
MNVLCARATDILTQNCASWSARAITRCMSSSARMPSIMRLTTRRCESCIDRLFTLGPQGCPICGKILRKMAFTPQTFEDLVVEKEVAVRRRIAKEYGLPLSLPTAYLMSSSDSVKGERISRIFDPIMTILRKSKISVCCAAIIIFNPPAERWTPTSIQSYQ